MKWAALHTALLVLAAPALAQLPPSPTASVGCVAHGDHWDCEGPAPATATGPTGTSTAAALGPSPTESLGCVAHGDHWDCQARRAGAAAATSTAAADNHEDEAGHEGHDHAEEEAAAAGAPPMPTESTGCHLHGDHWHCDGPASAAATAATAAPNASETPTGRGKCTWHENHWDCEKPAASATAAAPNASETPTGRGKCTWHETHWDCEKPAPAGSADAAHDAEFSGGECIIHVGHTHGDCSDEQLACGRILLEDYNMGLHIGAIFIILVGSAIGILIPIIAGWARAGGAPLDAASFGRGLGFWPNVFFIARHFGTGIIMSTAFVHLLYHGFVMFQNECVGDMAYEATAPAIAMASAFVTAMLDFVGSRAAEAKVAAKGAVHLHPAAPGAGGFGASSDGGSDVEKNAAQPVIADNCVHADALFQEEQGWQVMLLEAGIIFHSIMIGITLGAGSGAGWVTLLIVIVFHQFFEGAALGARMALLTWVSKVRIALMGLAFILITPVGIAIGIGIRQSFSQNGKASLLAVGILNSISAGILLYTAFKLLASDFVDGPLRRAKWSKVIAATLALIAGLICMSVLAKWA